MSSIKILIVEDEELIAEDMANKLTKFGYEVTDCVDNCNDALLSAKNNLPDLIFLDIMIARELDGIETAIKLKEIDDFPIIFLTNLSDDKTLQRAEVTNPAAYLLKPFSAEQLNVSIRTALRNSVEKRKAVFKDVAVESPDSLVKKDTLFLKDTQGTYIKYKIAEILFIEAGRAYCDIYLKDGTKLTQSSNMGVMNAKINHPDLIRVHRSHTVNIENIDAIKGKGNILVLSGHEVPVSDSFKEELLKRLQLI